MNKKMLLTMLLLLSVVFAVSTVSASEVNVTDSYTTNLVDDTTDASVPMENTTDSSVLSVSSDSNVDNDPSKVSLSSEEGLESENSNTLSTNSNDNSILSSDNGVTSSVLQASNVSSKIDIKNTITAKDVTKYYKGSTKYSAQLFDEYGNVLKKTNVKITVNGASYTRTTSENGVVSLSVNLKPGTYKVITTNPVTGYKLTTTFKILSTISASDISKIYTDGRRFTAKFYTSAGKPLANKNIKFKINGNTYTSKTNANGVASLSLYNLNKGTYKIISYNTDGLTKTNTVKVVTYAKTSLTTSTYTFLKSDSKTIKVTLLHALGYAPGAGKIVKITINGKTYNAKTNSKGVASLKLPSLNAGVYNVKYKFDGNVYYKASSASNKVYIIPSKTVTFTVKSTTTFGYGAGTPFKVAVTSGIVPIVGKTVTLNVNGKSYNRTTDSSGIVSLSMNMAVGKYVISYSIAKTAKTNAKSGSSSITVQKRTGTTVAWSGTTSFYQGSHTYKILLRDANNKALSGKTVKLTVNSKTYSAKTSSSGYASFTVNMPSGNYTVSYKFEGDNGYTASSGSKKVSVLKKNSGGYGYWVFGADMKSVNLNTLASKGTTDIFLNYYAISKHGQSAVETWIASANKLGIRVHIWMQAFYDGDWINPIKSGKVNTAYFNQKITEAKKYAAIKGVAGVHLDYLRYPGNAYKTSGGTAAISQFAKQVADAVHGVNSNLIVSCALMPETTDNAYYYGQDFSALSKYMDVVIPMIYKGNYNSGTSWITSTTKWFVSNSKGAQVWAGLQGYDSDDNVVKLSASSIKTDSQAALNGKASGVIIFRWGVTNFVDFTSLSGSSASSVLSANANEAATTTTTTSKTISIKNVITGATTLKNYYANNNKLPSTITAGGIKFTLPEFLYVMSQAIYQIGNSNTKDISIISGVSNPESPSGDTISSQELTKANYLTVAKNVANFIVKYNQAPNYASSAVGNIIYSELQDAFSRILAYYGTNSVMPNYVTIKYSSGSSSSSVSATGSGLNQKNTISDLSAYLKSSTNCQVGNSAIKSVVNSLTSGLTSDSAKAKAIYNYVRDSISYSFYYDTKYGAKGTLSAGYGNCVDQAHLVVAMFRTAGLAARYVHGTCTFSSGSTYGHVWAQVLIDGTWTVADPTSSRNSLGSIANWNTNSFSLNGIYSSISF